MDIVERLKEQAVGLEEWRVANPVDGSYVISFSRGGTLSPERDAREWLADHLTRNPTSWVAGYEVRKVMSQSGNDMLMIEAANEIARLRDELERERMRLAACGVVALANTPDSAKESRKMHEAYKSASCDDVARMVDEQMSLRDENTKLREDAERYRYLRDRAEASDWEMIGYQDADKTDAAIDDAMQKGE